MHEFLGRGILSKGKDIGVTDDVEVVDSVEVVDDVTDVVVYDVDIVDSVWQVRKYLSTG